MNERTKPLTEAEARDALADPRPAFLRHGAKLQAEREADALLADLYRTDSKSIGEANRSTWNESSRVRARVLVPCSLCQVNEARAGDWLCLTCSATVNGLRSSGAEAASFDDDPPDSWLGLAAFCGLMLVASGVAVVAAWVAKSAGWL